MKPVLLTGACLSALLIFPSAAQQAPAPRPVIGGHGDNVEAFIAQHDERGTGQVTWADFESFRRLRFDATDANGDGVVDVEEYVREFGDRLRQAQRQADDVEARDVEARVAGAERQTRVRFAALDADHDGRLTFAEYQVSGKRLFDSADRDGNGIVDAADAKLPPPPRPSARRDADAPAAQD